MGRSSYSCRRVIEHSTAVTIQYLLAAGVMKRDCDASWTNSITRNGKKITDVHYNVRSRGDDSYIRFQYQYGGQDLSFRHRIVRQPVHFGGYRYFFECGCSKKGRYCGRLVKALYRCGPVFACRHCLELVYLSCRYHRDWMLYSYWADALESKAERYRHNKHPRKANRLLSLVYDYRKQADRDFIAKALTWGIFR
jgi:hypothetical protein